MPKNNSFFLRLIKFFIISFYSLLIIDIFFYSDKLTYACKKYLLFPNSQILLVTFLFASIFFSIIPKIKQPRKFRHYDIVLIIFSSIILLILQFNISKNIYFETGWDVELISNTINKIIYNNWEVRFEEYFSYSPNNLFITGLLLKIKMII